MTFRSIIINRTTFSNPVNLFMEIKVMTTLAWIIADCTRFWICTTPDQLSLHHGFVRKIHCPMK